MIQHPMATRRGPGSFRDETVRVWLLGGFRLSVGPRTIEVGSWRLRKAAGLIKLLALAPGHSLHRERVMGILWPNLDAKSAANNLHRTLHFARAALGSGQRNPASRYLALRADLLALCPEGPLWVDVEAFEEAAASARRSRDPAAYRAAIELYADELLPENLYEEWTQEVREDLRRSYISLLLEMAGLYEEREEYAPAIEALERVVAEEPANEEAHVGLMRLYALAGRQSEAIFQYKRLGRLLSRELDAEPGAASKRLYEVIRAGKFTAAHSPSEGCPSEEPVDSWPNNLPVPLTSFVGREREALQIKRLLPMTRLLTLTGAGGSGKTRLALEIARDLVGTYPDGIWLVELAALSRPELASQAVAAALGVPEQAGRPLEVTLTDYLGSRSLLLVLDNCEHLVDGAARLASALLGACPNLKILATSREPLGVPGEVVWTVPPLSLPGADGESTVEGLMLCEAVRLFVDRARSRLPAFELKGENAGTVARICRRLDGIPLAIELATARMGALAVEQVAERLEDSLGLLTGGARTMDPRQQTMRATLKWSHDLLSEQEQRLLRRLSIFAGGWTLEAAESVGAGGGIEEDGVLDLLLRLVNKSMVVVEATREGVRYGMLEPVRWYGQERLKASEEADAVRQRHASWYFELARKVEPWLRGARQEVWLRQLEREYGNLRAALRWALERGEADLGLWFGGALADFWYMSGHLSEGRRWLEAALANGGDAPPTPTRIRALARAGWIAWEQGDYESSVAFSEESLMLSRELKDEAGAVAALSNLGWAALLRNDLEKASALTEEAVTLGRALGDTGGVARAILILGLAAVAKGDDEHALALSEENLTLARKSGDSLTMSLSLVMGAFASLGRGDNRRARTLCEESLALSPQPRVMNATAFQLHASAALAGSQGQPVRSARLWGAAESLRETIGAALSPVELSVYAPYIAAARARLGETAWEETWAEGKTMAVEEAVEYALAEREEQWQPRPKRPPAPKEPPPGRQPDVVLTRRQREVALLVARGLTNRQISSELSISEYTVANHVAAITRKLNVPSRSRIAVWVTERSLRKTE